MLSGRGKKTLQKIIGGADRWAMENILDHTPFLDKNTNRTQRLECYDISHLSGKETVGVLTVLIRRGKLWRAEPSQFRKFKVKTAKPGDDPAAIAEVLNRRFLHPEWPYPDIIVIDGGIAQHNTAKKIIDNFFRLEQSQRATINLISFAKPTKRIYGNKKIVDKEIIEQAIAQTHRYAINFHRFLRDKIKL